MWKVRRFMSRHEGKNLWCDYYYLSVRSRKMGKWENYCQMENNHTVAAKRSKLINEKTIITVDKMTMIIIIPETILYCLHSFFMSSNFLNFHNFSNFSNFSFFTFSISFSSFFFTFSSRFSLHFPKVFR